MRIATLRIHGNCRKILHDLRFRHQYFDERWKSNLISVFNQKAIVDCWELDKMNELWITKYSKDNLVRKNQSQQTGGQIALYINKPF